MNTQQDAAQRDLQVSKYWEEFLAELNRLFKAQAELYKRLDKVLRPRAHEEKLEQTKIDSGELCSIAYELAMNCKIVNLQLNNIQDILDRLEI